MISSSITHSSINITSSIINNGEQQQQQPLKYHHPQIVIVRHGERADKYPELKHLQEPENCNLTEAGFVQAMGIGQYIREQYEKNEKRNIHNNSNQNNNSNNNDENNNNNDNNQKRPTLNKWRVISSPFTRTLQTASAIVASLGAECCESSTIEVDFECGERLKVLSVPEGVLKLTEERASQIVREGYNFALEVRRKKFGDHTSTTSSFSNVFEPTAKFGFGDSSCVHPAEKLEAGGRRLYRAVNRLYDKLITEQKQHSSDSESENNTLPNLLIVTHGFAPSQLLKLVYGHEAIDATRIFLCSAMCLQPFESLSERTQRFILDRQPVFIGKNNHHHHHNHNHIQNNNEHHENSENDKNNNNTLHSSSSNIHKPKFTIVWTRGVKWRIPEGQARVVISQHHQKHADQEEQDHRNGDDGSDVLPTTISSQDDISSPTTTTKIGPCFSNEDDFVPSAAQSDRQNEGNNSNDSHNNNLVASVSQPFSLAHALSLDPDRIFYESPYSTSAEEPDTHGVVEKVWYESKAVNADKPDKWCLGFSLDADSPPPLIPVALCGVGE